MIVKYFNVSLRQLALRQLAEVEQKIMYIVYAIHNIDHDKIYIGQTENMERRLFEHNCHILKGFTSRYEGEWRVIHQELFETRIEALKREKQLKSYQGRQFVRSKLK